MTKIIETLKADLVTAMKAAKHTEDAAEQKNQEAKKTVLRALIGAVQTAEKAGKTSVEFSDEQVVALLGSEAKKRRETAVVYSNAGETERAAVELAEVEIISTYLPAQLTEVELRTIVREAIRKADQPNFGLVMKGVTSQTKGRADGKLVSEMVKEELAARQ